MIDPLYDHPDLEFERKVQAAFPVPDPDPAFVDRLQREFMDRYKAFGKASKLPEPRTRYSNLSGQTRRVLAPLAWGAFALFLILTLIWGINNLIPGKMPGVSVVSSPSPALTVDNRLDALASPSPTVAPTSRAAPTPRLPTVPTFSMENANFYTVLEGDTLPSIADKTGVPIETLQDLNEFVLQLNGLVPGLQLITGFDGQEPVFYTVQPGDTMLGVADKVGISMEDLATLNRIGVYAPGVPTPLPVPHYNLMPGMRLIIGLEDLGIKKNEITGGKQFVLSETDLNCDGRAERIFGIEAQEIENFNIQPQLSAIILETITGRGQETVWEYSAQETGVAYLAYQLFQADDWTQFMVLIGQKGKEGVKVFRWDGE